MTEEEMEALVKEVHALREEMKELAELRELRDDVEFLCREVRGAGHLVELKGKVEEIDDVVLGIQAQVSTMIALARGLNGKAEKAGQTFTTLVQYIGIAIVPIIVALVGMFAILWANGRVGDGGPL